MCSGNGNICVRLITEDSAEALTVNGEQSNPFPISLWLPHFDLENIKGPIWDP